MCHFLSMRIKGLTQLRLLFTENILKNKFTVLILHDEFDNQQFKF
jgi:hypothetical protein